MFQKKLQYLGTNNFFKLNIQKNENLGDAMKELINRLNLLLKSVNQLKKS